MANKRCRSLDKEEYTKLILAIRNGVVREDGTRIKANPRVAMALMLEANLGLRIGDIVKLRLSSIVYESGKYHLDIVEQKTGRKRLFTVPTEVYSAMQSYALEMGIGPKAKLFDITVRGIQIHLQQVCKELGIEGVSTHSFRKFFAMSIYNDNGYNLELVRVLLQHSSVVVSQHYLSVSNQQVELALRNHLVLV